MALIKSISVVCHYETLNTYFELMHLIYSNGIIANGEALKDNCGQLSLMVATYPDTCKQDVVRKRNFTYFSLITLQWAETVPVL